MQFPGKLTTQISENGKKTNFGPDFATWPKIVPSYYPVQFKRNDQ